MDIQIELSDEDSDLEICDELASGEPRYEEEDSVLCVSSGDENSGNEGTPDEDTNSKKSNDEEDQSNEKVKSEKKSAARKLAAEELEACCSKSSQDVKFLLQDGQEDYDDEDTEGWEVVTPEMLKDTLGKTSYWHATSTVTQVVEHLRLNYPVCQRLKELTVEVSDKLQCAEEIGMVIKNCVKNSKSGEIEASYRLASPLEKTFLSEWEVKEFWSYYREILRRSKREQKQPKTNYLSLSPKFTSRASTSRRSARAPSPKMYNMRTRYSSDESDEYECCCNK